ncbi:hypothetical protein A4D02_09450 [Niastella koreensis]|uniref:Anti-FecI sigma factor, FecR n=2 Tax=Niastella koreensis TaxID=354356 RepID=G8TM01_NIAKG|nr:FecR family protein [Niastella koreensis]AEV98761.1 anti-FecI sigma factor, FecR [Niastella koreensis GR20-10]OQP43699.1 hypothetical protein A4D02_09450 [Niastella koreensis]
MKKNNERLSRLFQGYYENTLSREETDELFQLLYREGDDEQLNALIVQAWQQLQEEAPRYTTSNSDSILNSILEDIHSRRDDRSEKQMPAKLFWLKRVAAAAFVVILAGAFYFIFRQRPVPAVTASTSPALLQKDSLYNNNKAILRLANGSVIVLDTLKSGAFTRQGNMQISKTADGQLLYKVKDSAGGVYATAINTISTPYGGQYQVQLQDGTKVWLNATSTLRFPVSFASNERRVSITGEVYFEVVRNVKKPFIVNIPGGAVEVLGTHFNVNAYDDEKVVKTTLLEGKVKVRQWSKVNDQSASAKTSAEKSVVLKPGEQAIAVASPLTTDPADSRHPGKVGNSPLTIDHSPDLEEVLAWKNNLFSFTDVGIEEVMRQAARWYHIRVQYKGTISQSEFNGKIPRTIKLAEFLNILRYKGINVSVTGQDVTIIN